MLKNLNKIKIKEINEPFFIFKPETLTKDVKYFLNHFSGETIYAVKTNPSEFILKQIYKLGVKSFDAASINEVELVRNLFTKSKIYFMNPVKPVNSIKKAYFDFGVRDFSLDSNQELQKILHSTNQADDLNLHLRFSVPNNFSKIKLSKKFGVDGLAAERLLIKTKEVANKIGVSFHIGSQCMNPDAYKISINKVVSIIKKTKISLDYFNIGGGFPSEYYGLKPPKLESYFNVINKELSKHCLLSKVKLLSEPGRILVSNSMSLIVRVDLRKKKNLFINDGIHGHLYTAKEFSLLCPVKIFNKNVKSKLVAFDFYGPTCDSNDFIKGPFFLPDSIKEGDHIELKNMGAYTVTMNKNFNGFYSKPKVFKDKSKDN